MKTHVKMVEAFEGFAGFCSGLGGKYNPGEENLQLTALATLLAKAKAALHNVDDSKARLDLAKSHRALLFKDLPARASQVVYRLAAAGASDYIVRDARSLARQISGARAKKRPVVGADAAVVDGQKPHSVLQLAYVSKAQNFGRLLELVKKVPQYKPLEEGLTVASLTAHLKMLQQANTHVLQARETHAMALRLRNSVLYHQAHSLVNTARSAKMYLRALFGFSSPEYRALCSLQFAKLVGL